MKFALLLAIPLLGVCADSPEAQLRKALEAKTGSVTLPAGAIEISREIVIPSDAHDLDIRGAGTTLKASDNFRGRALLVFAGGKNIRVHDLALDGNREAVGHLIGSPPQGTMYSRFMPDNGILAENVAQMQVFDVKSTLIAGFTILANASANFRIHDVEITLSGGFNAQRRNNGAGGILLEEGSNDFEILRCQFGGIRGNGVTIRNSDRGNIEEDEFAVLARNAIQITNAKSVVIDNNNARQIGAPTAEVDGQPVCMNLDRFDDGAITNNTCTDQLLGAIAIAGSRNKVTGNRLLRINLAQRDAAGIFVAAGAGGNTIEANEITGFGMSRHCVGGASGSAVAATNRIAKNDCSDEASVARLQRAIRR